MPRTRLLTPALAAANLLLALSLGLAAAARTAEAQVGPTRARGSYALTAGKTNAGSWQAVYVLDAANQELVALRWDNARQQLVGLSYRNLRTDAADQPGR